MPVVNNCCKCIGLRKAVITIGIIELIFDVLGLLIMATVKMKFKVVGAEVSQAIAMVLGLLFYGMCIVIGIFLIVGAVKRKRWYMFPWLVLSLILKFGFLITSFVTGIVYIADSEPAIGFSVIVISLCWTGFFIYIWIVVYSYFDELKVNPPNRA